MSKNKSKSLLFPLSRLDDDDDDDYDHNVDDDSCILYGIEDIHWNTQEVTTSRVGKANLMKLTNYSKRAIL